MAGRRRCGESAGTTCGKEHEMEDTVVTREGLTRLREELEHLTTVERRGIAERLKQAAASEANREENGDYVDAREQQALLERRIALLEERIRSARPVEPKPGNGLVDVGERVHVRDLTTGDRLELESDPDAGRISVLS